MKSGRRHVSVLLKTPPAQVSSIVNSKAHYSNARIDLLWSQGTSPTRLTERVCSRGTSPTVREGVCSRGISPTRLTEHVCSRGTSPTVREGSLNSKYFDAPSPTRLAGPVWSQGTSPTVREGSLNSKYHGARFPPRVRSSKLARPSFTVGLTPLWPDGCFPNHVRVNTYASLVG